MPGIVPWVSLNHRKWAVVTWPLTERENQTHERETIAVYGHSPVITATQETEAERDECKACLFYRVSSRTTWATY